MGEEGAAEMRIMAATSVCLELMEEAISSGPFKSGFGQL